MRIRRMRTGLVTAGCAIVAITLAAPASATGRAHAQRPAGVPATGTLSASVVVGNAGQTGTARGHQAVASRPGQAAATQLTLTPTVVYNVGKQPRNATKCVPSVVCQYLVSYGGKGLDLSSWTAKAFQYPADGTVCNPASYFYYNVNEGGPDLWEYATFSGCRTAPPNGEVIWTSSNAAPVYFSGNNHVEVYFEPIWGATPTAYVHS